IRGTRERPAIAGDVTIVNGRIRRVSYEKLAGHVDYSADNFAIDFRVDEAPGVWLTVKGTVPRSLFDANLPERPFNVAVLSSPINLALMKGWTDVFTKVRGTLRVDLKAMGTSRDPRFDGLVEL